MISASPEHGFMNMWGVGAGALRLSSKRPDIESPWLQLTSDCQRC
jgi:hypothetical protein